MPKDEIDYSNTIFYKIYCKTDDVKDIYVGHTTNFVQRKYMHKAACNRDKCRNHNLKVYQFIREHGGWNNWKMDIVGFHECNDHYEARKVEQKYFETLHATLNSIEPLPKPKPKIIKEKIVPTSIPKTTTITKEKEDKIVQKGSLKYVCNCCDYSTSRNSQYNRHLSTRKHKINHFETVTGTESYVNYKCDICESEFNSRTTLWRHTTKCSSPKSIEKPMLKEYNSYLVKELIPIIKELILDHYSSITA